MCTLINTTKAPSHASDFPESWQYFFAQDGGEEYLTFNQCTVNEGGGMDPKSGIFLAPVAGAYCISFHVSWFYLRYQYCIPQTWVFNVPLIGSLKFRYPIACLTRHASPGNIWGVSCWNTILKSFNQQVIFCKLFEDL